ncbi:hypothetical protein FCM35_KLT06024 [Carex littledalei]|uniref:Uncharacterized protein n=1 Tax=Carex littledalei TaxID=544730 RepID=A0A833V8U1_9POAL|nr:hypothetical protein FCM35_KLT06024 [Carex littledalei]
MLTRILQDLAYFFEIPLHHSKPFLSLKNSGRRSPTNPSSSKVSLVESPSPIGVYPSRAVANRSLPKSRLQRSPSPSPSPIGVYPSRAVAYRSLPKSHLQRSPSPSPSPIGVTQVFVVSIDLISEEGSAVKCSRLNKSDKTQADVPPPPPPSEDPQPKLPPPNTPETPAAVPMPNPPPAQQPDKTVRGRAKRSRLSTCSPTRRSSRFNKPDTSQADQGTPVEPSMPAPSKSKPPKQPEATVPMPSMPAPSKSEPPKPSMPPPSEDSGPADPPPNTPETPAGVPMPNPQPAQQLDKTVRGRAKRSRSSTCSPIRRSSRFNKPDSSQADQGPPVEPSVAAETVQRDVPPPILQQEALYEDLKENYNARMSDEDLWDIAVDGEDAKGRLFGFGHRSRTCKGNKELAKEDATLSDHAKSTATSAEDESTTFTKSQVVVMIKSQVAAERRRLLADIAAQEARHNADREEFKKKEEQNKKLFAELFKRTGAPLTTFTGGHQREMMVGEPAGGEGETIHCSHMIKIEAVICNNIK